MKYLAGRNVGERDWRYLGRAGGSWPLEQLPGLENWPDSGATSLVFLSSSSAQVAETGHPPSPGGF